MALTSCPECHAQVSDQARACPRCGYPIASSAANAANKPNAPAEAGSTWRSILLLALMIGGGLFLWQQMERGSINIPGAASFEVVGQRGDDSCSSLLEYCLRVTCIVRNKGIAPGAAQVELRLLSPEGTTRYVKSISVPLKTGESREVSHDFTEASLFGNDARYSCEVH